MSTTFINTASVDKTFQQSGKQNSFKQILKILTIIYEASASE